MNLTNTERAFKAKSTQELRYSYWLFRLMTHPWLVRAGTWLLTLALKLGLPVSAIVRATLFRQFCGGETLEESLVTASRLSSYGIGTILDYAVEGTQDEATFNSSCEEFIHNICIAEGKKEIPFTVLKMTALARFELLEKISAKQRLSPAEGKEWESVKGRLKKIGEEAHSRSVRVFVDAEESWIQDATDQLVTEMMEQLNKERALIFNTLQMYRTGRYHYLQNCIKEARAKKYFLGLKIVRGAYLEKERERANEKGVLSPVHSTKDATDADYDRALKLCIENVDVVATCAGTHNEQSTLRLVELMAKANLPSSDDRIHFAQLLGMSDHLSYNLAASHYNSAKYVPYGQVRVLIPYLIRRAQENTAIQGQTGREVWLIAHELKRRSLSPA